MHATAGSAVLDSAQTNISRCPQIQWHKISTGVYGPLLSRTVGMVLGRSGLTSQEFTVHPRTIDKDFRGEIKVIAQVKREMQVNVGNRIAQL